MKAVMLVVVVVWSPLGGLLLEASRNRGRQHGPRATNVDILFFNMKFQRNNPRVQVRVRPHPQGLIIFRHRLRTY